MPLRPRWSSLLFLGGQGRWALTSWTTMHGAKKFQPNNPIIRGIFSSVPVASLALSTPKPWDQMQILRFQQQQTTSSGACSEPSAQRSGPGLQFSTFWLSSGYKDLTIDDEEGFHCSSPQVGPRTLHIQESNAIRTHIKDGHGHPLCV